MMVEGGEESTGASWDTQTQNIKSNISTLGLLGLSLSLRWREEKGSVEKHIVINES